MRLFREDILPALAGFALLGALVCGVSVADAAEPGARGLSPAGLAVQDLIDTYGARYPGGADALKRVEIAAAIADSATSVSAREAAFTELERATQEALLANPLLTAHPILFTVRRQFVNEHGTEATMYQTGEINTACFAGGGALKVLRIGPGGEASVSTLLDLPEGVVRDPNVHFSGEKIVFSMRRNIEDDYHLYEMRADGSGLTQLTFAPRVSDIQPIYMPDDRIVFSSTRDPKYIPCQRHLMANLFTMNADGTNIRQLGHNTQFEGHSSLTPDGRILYTRWEYVDKHYASAYGLWTANPDGTNHALYYGGYGWQPGGIVNARAIPGTQRFVAIFTAVHELPWGAMVVVDRRRALDGMEPIVRSWPPDVSGYMNRWQEVGRVGGAFDSFRGIPIKYEDPYPLSEKYFLCSRSIEPAQGRKTDEVEMGLFLVDVFGNEVLLHREAPACFDPQPLAPRERPPVVPERIDLRDEMGTFYVQDVYAGEFMDRVERGTVKYIRIVEAPPKRTFPPYGIGDWTPALNPDGHHPVAVNWGHYNHKRILGKAPVEADGSAHFRVPSGKFVYFQLLDENDMMVHSMRSGTTAQPGETMGCVGCHDHRLASPPAAMGKAPQALRRAPSELEPWYGESRLFSYAAEVQPVLDRHCVKCHDYDKPGAKALVLAGDKGPAFNLSYTALRSRSPSIWEPSQAKGPKPLISSIDAGPIRVVPPYSWGSHRSRLIDMLRKGHKNVELEKEDLERLATWIDLNTPYYPSHVTFYQMNTFGRCPLDHAQLARLGELVARGPRGAEYGWGSVNDYGGGRLLELIATQGSPINFTRPERSLVLRAFDDTNCEAYREALGLIRAGGAMLREHPRADMPGFQPCEADRKRVEYAEARSQVEARNRRAILEGRFVSDRDTVEADTR